MVTIPTSRSEFPKYSLIILAYNETGRISRFLSELDDEAFEYIFVCDGADKGGGIMAGFNVTHAFFIGFINADCSVSLKTIKKLSDFNTSGQVFNCPLLPVICLQPWALLMGHLKIQVNAFERVGAVHLLPDRLA